MDAAAERAVQVAVVSDHPMLMQPLTTWLSRDCRVESVFIDSRSGGFVSQCRRHRSKVIVVDQHSANGSLRALVGELHRGISEAKVLLLTSRTDAQSIRLAAEAGCAGVVSTDQPPESLLSAVMAAHGVPIPPSAAAADHAPLTAREQAVLGLLADGMGTAALAAQLGIARNTARAHVQHVISKLGAHSKLEAVAIARRSGLV